MNYGTTFQVSRHANFGTPVFENEEGIGLCLYVMCVARHGLVIPVILCDTVSDSVGQCEWLYCVTGTGTHHTHHYSTPVMSRQ